VSRGVILSEGVAVCDAGVEGPLSCPQRLTVRSIREHTCGAVICVLGVRRDGLLKTCLCIARCCNRGFANAQEPGGRRLFEPCAARADLDRVGCPEPRSGDTVLRQATATQASEKLVLN
jgi:hypothetical protein